MPSASVLISTLRVKLLLLIYAETWLIKYFLYEYIPAGTWRKYNVASTSMQRHDVASTLMRRCIYMTRKDVASTYVKTLHRRWCNVFTCHVNTTSHQRRCNVMTLHRRWGDVVFTSCACRDCGQATILQQHGVATSYRRHHSVGITPMLDYLLSQLHDIAEIWLTSLQQYRGDFNVSYIRIAESHRSATRSQWNHHHRGIQSLKL